MKEPKDHPFVILSRALPMQVIGFMVVQVAVAVIVTVGGSVALGLFIDTRVTNTKPLFTLLLSLIGAILSVYLTYRLAMRAVPKARKAYEDWAGSKENPASAAPEGARPTSGRV